MTLEPQSNLPAPAINRCDTESGRSRGGLDALALPQHAVLLRRESHALESIFIQDVDSRILSSLFCACKIPISQDGADDLISTLARGEVPSGRTLSGRILDNKTIQFKGYLELVAGRGRITQTNGFQLLDMPENLPDIVLAHEKGRNSLSLSILFDLSDLTTIKSMYAHWQRCDRIVSACGVKVPDQIHLQHLDKTLEGGVDENTEWYRAQLAENTFISVTDISYHLYQGKKLQRQFSAKPRVSCHQPRIILFDSSDTETITRVLHAIEASTSFQSMTENKRDVLVRLIGLVVQSLEENEGVLGDTHEHRRRNITDLLFEFATDAPLLHFENGVKCVVRGGWRSRAYEPMDCVEVKIHGFKPKWGYPFSLFIKLDPNQSRFPLFGLEWDQGSVDQAGAAVTTLRQMCAFLSAFVSSNGSRRYSEDEVRTSILHEIKSLPQAQSPLLFWPFALSSESINLGCYERICCENEESLE
jgi:hypothetical protein